MSAVLAILDRARWAPSGDNVQNWGFEVIDESHVVVHGFDTRDHVVYDLDGTSSQIALGALLETIAIAASCVASFSRKRSVSGGIAQESRLKQGRPVAAWWNAGSM